MNDVGMKSAINILLDYQIDMGYQMCWMKTKLFFAERRKTITLDTTSRILFNYKFLKDVSFISAVRI